MTRAAGVRHAHPERPVDFRAHRVRGKWRTPGANPGANPMLGRSKACIRHRVVYLSDLTE